MLARMAVPGRDVTGVCGLPVEQTPAMALAMAVAQEL